MWEQVRRDELRESRRKGVLFSLMLLTDVAVIYLFWNYGTRKTAASQVAAGVQSEGSLAASEQLRMTCIAS